MKRYQKIAMSAVLAGVLTGVRVNTNQVLASESTLNVVNAEIINGETYVIDNKGTLYTNNEVSQFNKVLDGVKQVFESEDYNSVYILKSDNTLVLGIEKRGTLTDESTGKLTLNNTWTFKEVEKNVKSISVDNYGDTAVILKNDGTMVYIEEAYYYVEDLIAGNPTSSYKETLKLKAKEILVDGDSNFYIIDQSNVLYNLGDVSYGGFNENTPVKVMDNVKSITTYNEGLVVLKNDGIVYAEVLGYFYGNAYMYGDIAKEFGGKADSSYFSKYVYLTDGVKAVQQGSDSTFIIKNDDSLWAFGDNYYGELGIPESSQIVSVFTKVASNVADVASGYDATVYVTKDGKLMAMGDIEYIQISNSDVEKPVLFDQDDLYTVESDVIDMELEYYFSTYLKSDKSLWVVGESGMGSEYGYDLVKVADDVEQVGSTEYALAYIIGSDLYYADGVGDSGYYYEYYGDGDYSDIDYDMMTYLLELVGLDDEYTADDVFSEDFDLSIIEDRVDSFDYDKQEELAEKYDAYFLELRGGVSTAKIASNVTNTDGRFYLTADNELFGALGNDEQYKIATGVVSFYSDDLNLYIIDKNGNVKFTQIDSEDDFGVNGVTFYNTGISNAKAVISNNEYYDYSIYVLDNKNTLTYYGVESDTLSDVDSDAKAKEAFIEDALIREVDTNVVDFAPGDGDCYYVLSDGTMNVYDTYYELGDIEFVTDNVKAIDGNNYGDVLILKNNGKLYSKGYNAYGELGYAPDEYEASESVYTPFEVKIVVK